MKTRLRSWLVPLLACVALPAFTQAASLPSGAVLFMRHCAPCHGTTGRGDGPDGDMFTVRPRDLHEGFLDKYDDQTLVRRIRSGRGLPLGLDMDAIRRHANDVDALVKYMRQLPDLDWKVLEPGWETWVDRCEICHGSTGEGTGTPNSLPPLATAEFQASVDEASLLAAVRHARRPGLPAHDPMLTAEEVREVAAFIRLLSPGFSLYTRICAGCHSEDGRGAATLSWVMGDEFPPPNIIFDRAYFEKRDSVSLRSDVWHMLERNKPQMPHFRIALTEEEATAVVRYLRQSVKEGGQER